MNIAIIGYGRMGKEVERIAIERNHMVSVRIDNESDWQAQEAGLQNVDIAIDFSLPEVAPGNILRCFKLNLPVVSGTTGWKGKLPEIRSLCESSSQSLFFAPNFSIGVNLFFEINRRLAQLMNDRKEYEVSIEEIHHELKADAPSGTAIQLADEIVHQMSRKKGWVNKSAENIEEISIQSYRQGNEPGTHIVSYESEFDVLEIKHTAKSRRGFALGAILAAEWLLGKKGCFDMKDLLFGKCAAK